MSKKLLTQKEACEYLNISRSTILRWEKQEIINPIKTVGNHRRYKIEELDSWMGENNTNSNSKNCLIYARVSTKKQQESGNLERQTSRLMEYAVNNKYNIKTLYKEVASGINEDRKELMKLLKEIENKEVNYLIIEYKDRLARFGYNYIEQYCKSYNVEIIVVEKKQEKNLNEEMVEDMISIITSFSARIYGRRGGRKVKETILSLEKEDDDSENNS